MADRSRIEWTDRTWNPVTGCTKLSPGCEHCYAEAIAHRFAGSAAFPAGFALTLHPTQLDAPRRWRTPSRVFVNSIDRLGGGSCRPAAVHSVAEHDEDDSEVAA